MTDKKKELTAQGGSSCEDTAANQQREGTMSEEEIEQLLRTVDSESATRNLSSFWQNVVKWISVAFCLFQIYTAIFGALQTQIQRSIHLSFALSLAFLLFPRVRGRMEMKVSPLDILLVVGGASGGVYWSLFLEDIVYRVGNITPFDFFMGVMMILVVMEATRRVIGYTVLGLVTVSLLYCYFGAYFPSFFQHRGFSINRIVRHMYLGTEGILGVPIGVVSTFVFVFLLFGAFLKRTGVGQFFNDFANALTGKAVGGPAKVAVISSALQGTISGSSVANVAASGSFTIPLMKKCGYSPEFAAAVEASASTGGQLMPPIMGAAAFLMAEFTGIPYWSVALSAAIPAILYFTGIFFAVHIEAKKRGLKGVVGEQVQSVKEVVSKRGILFLPVIVIVVTISTGMTATRAGLYGTLSAVLVGALYQEHRLRFHDYLEIFQEAAKTGVGVAVVCAAAGIVVGMVTLTGLGLKLGTGLVQLAGGNLILTMFLAMISSLVLGMGVPTTANYVITSTIVAPALTELGVPLIAAHLFVFYFGIIADITPPVCEAVFTGAAIAKANALKSGFTATKIAIGAFIIPYMFVLSPQLVLVDANILDMCRVVPGALLGMFSLSCAASGWLRYRLNVLERLMLGAGGLFLIDSGIITDFIGVALFASIFLWQGYNIKKNLLKTQAEPTE